MQVSNDPEPDPSDTVFTDDAVTLIHGTSRGHPRGYPRGHPRAVNNLAVQSLLCAYADGKSSSTRPGPGPPSPKSPPNRLEANPTITKGTTRPCAPAPGSPPHRGCY